MSTLPAGKANVVITEDGNINIHVSAKTMYNIDECSTILRGVLGRVGCPGCTSGLPIAFQLMEEEFSV
jgi:hypothetical protein